MDYNTIKNVALAVLIAVAVIGLLLALLVKKIVGKIISLVIAVVLVILVWQQRAHITSAYDDAKNKAHDSYCNTHPKFLGIQVTMPGC